MLPKALLLLSLLHFGALQASLTQENSLRKPQDKPAVAAENIQRSEQKNSSTSPATRSIAFTPPQGWQEADTKLISPHVKLMFVGKGKGIFPPSINLGMEAYSGTMRQRLKAIKAANEIQKCHWLDLGKLQTPAGEGYLFQEDTQTQFGEMRMMHLLLLSDGTFYMMTAAAAKNEFPSYYKAFYDSMRSLHFIDAPKEVLAEK